MPWGIRLGQGNGLGRLVRDGVADDDPLRAHAGQVPGLVVIGEHEDLALFTPRYVDCLHPVGEARRSAKVNCASSTWVYETDLLVCPKCSVEMHIISFVDQRAVIIHSKRNSIAL